MSHNIICLIEPLAIRSSYYLRCYSQAQSILDKLNLPNLKIMVDSYHMQMLNGNLTKIVNELSLKNQIGHVQVSQAPLRDSPMSVGEIDFNYFFDLINKTGYDDYVGLEYNGKLNLDDLNKSNLNAALFKIATSDESFDWLNKFK